MRVLRSLKITEMRFWAEHRSFEMLNKPGGTQSNHQALKGLVLLFLKI
jgi:hypothetical protein